MRISINRATTRSYNTFLGMKIAKKYYRKVVKTDLNTIRFQIVQFTRKKGQPDNIVTRINCMGSIFSTVKDILQKLNIFGEVYLTKERKLFRLTEDDRVFNKCIYYEEGVERTPTITNKKCDDLWKDTAFKMHPHCNILIFTYNKSGWSVAIRGIKKLVIVNSFVQNVCLDELPSLKYLDLSCNYLEDIVCKKPLQYCNLSHNNLTYVEISSNNLNLSHNNISFFYSKDKLQVLDLEGNPLKVLSATAQIVNVTNTKIRNLFCRGIKKLICCNNRNINLICTEDLVFVNLNNCKLASLELNSHNLKVVKLRNNRFKSLPSLGPLEYLDIAGNKLKDMPKCDNIKCVNIKGNPFKSPIVPAIDKGHNLAVTDNGVFNGSKMIGSTKITSSVTKMNHIFKTIQKYCICVPRYVFCRLYLVVGFNKSIDVEDCINRALLLSDYQLTNQEYFNCVSDRLTNNFRMLGDLIGFYGVLVEESKIFLKSVNLPFVFTSFAVHKVLENSVTYVYENIGRWYVFPLLGCSEVIRRKVGFVAESEAIFPSMDISCPYTKDLKIFNSPELYFESTKEVHLIAEYSLVDRCPVRSLSKNLGELSFFGEGGLVSSIIPTFDVNAASNNLFNHNPFKSLPCPGLVNSTGDSSDIKNTNTFIFLKFYSDKNNNCIRIAPLNHIIGTLCKIFEVVLFEEHDYQCGVFLCFNRAQGLIFAMYVYRILKHNHIRLSIGVVSGDYSLRWSVFFPKIFGLGLNKSARYAAMGEGVFCCKCVMFNHNNLIYISHGKRKVKGFTERMEVFSAHFKNPFKQFL